MDSPVDKIKERLPITDVVAQYVKLEKAGRNLKARCPFHRERTASFFVSPERNTFYCFGCGEKGDIFTFTQKLEGIDFAGALRLLAERAGIPASELKFKQDAGRKEEKERLYALMDDAAAFFEKELAARPDVVAYLKGRGLSEESVRHWRLGYARPEWRALTAELARYGEKDLVASGLSIRSEKKDVGIYDRFRGRIMFPIADAAGRVIAFSGRYFEKTEGSTDGVEPAKYVNSPETALFKKSFVLHGLDRAKGPIRTSNFSILVEGQMDLLMSHQSGFPNTIALSGTALTEQHLKSLGFLSKRLVLALDSDEAGIRSTQKSSHLALSLGFDVKAAHFPQGLDPADVAKEGKEAYRTTIRESLPVIEFMLERLRERAKDVRGFRKEAETHILPLMAAIPSAIDRSHFVGVVARVLELPREAVEEDLRAVASGVRAEEREELRTGAPQPLSPLECAIGMLLALSSEGDEMRKRLSALIDYSPYETKLLPHRERLLFEFESQEGGEAAITDLLMLVRRVLLEDAVKAARAELANAERDKDEHKASELLGRLQALAREKETLGEE